MITRTEYEGARRRATGILSKTRISIRPDELERMEVADFGFGELEQSGAQIVTLVDTEKVAAKLLVLFPHQTLPEHRHPPLGTYPGKEETIRCEWGEVYVNGPGERTAGPKGSPPESRRSTYTVWHEHILQPGDQITFAPNTPHWFQAGPQGAVIWSFSTKAVDIQDIFTDPEVQRQTLIGDE